MTITNIGHVVLPSRDVERSMSFYEKVLGMQRVAYLERARMGFLSFGTVHHDVALCQVDSTAAGPLGSPGNSHTGIHVAGGPDELGRLHRRLSEAGVDVDAVHDFGFMHGFYFLDPDGNRLELFCDLMEDSAALELLRSKETASVAGSTGTPSG